MGGKKRGENTLKGQGRTRQINFLEQKKKGFAGKPRPEKPSRQRK